MRYLAVILGFFASLIISACSETRYGKDFPTPTVGFQPRSSYDLTFDQVWQTAISTLRENQITIANANKDIGQITTDYIEGPGHSTVSLVLSSQSVRYKYTIFISSVTPATTNLRIKATLESFAHVAGMVSQSSATLPYRDVSSENPTIVKSLETWLYEQIERSL